jgi:signal transduction histidine kinase
LTITVACFLWRVEKKDSCSKFVQRYCSSLSAARSSSDGSMFKLSISNEVEKSRKGNYFRSSWNHDSSAGSFRLPVRSCDADMISFLYRMQTAGSYKL